MSFLCEAALALGMTLGGLCQAEAPAEDLSLPEGDREAWSYKPADPPPPPPPPPEPVAPPPVFPPVVVIREAPAPPPPPPPPPAPVVVAPPPLPDPLRLALEAQLGRRHLVQPQPFGGILGLSGTTGPGGLSAPALDPLDQAAPKPAPRYESEGRVSSLPVDNSRILTADRFITGILETGVNSQLDSEEGGSLIIQTARDVFGYHGRNVLIPKGSRLICDYKSPENLGSTRIPVECNRVLLAGHRAEILQIGSAAGDVQGRAGLTGEIDNRFWEKYGTAFVLAGISAAVRFASATAATGEEEDNLGQVADQGSQELSEKLGEITASVLEQSVDLVPIITIPQGTRLQIRPAKDWYIRKFEEEGEKS